MHPFFFVYIPFILLLADLTTNEDPTPIQILPPMYMRPKSSTEKTPLKIDLNHHNTKRSQPKNKPKPHDCHCRKKSESREQAELDEYLDWMEQNSRANEYRFSIDQVPYKPETVKHSMTTSTVISMATPDFIEPISTLPPEVQKSPTPSSESELDPVDLLPEPTTTTAAETTTEPVTTTTVETITTTEASSIQLQEDGADMMEGNSIDDNLQWPTSAYVFEEDSEETNIHRSCACRPRNSKL